MNANLSPEPIEQDVQKEAYLLYIASGCVPGHDLDNWLSARARLMSRQQVGRAEQAVSTAISHLHFPLNASVSRSPFGDSVSIPSHN